MEYVILSLRFFNQWVLYLFLLKEDATIFHTEYGLNCEISFHQSQFPKSEHKFQMTLQVSDSYPDMQIQILNNCCRLFSLRVLSQSWINKYHFYWNCASFKSFHLFIRHISSFSVALTNHIINLLLWELLVE